MLTFSLTVPVCDKTPIEILVADRLRLKRVERCEIIKQSIDARKKGKVCYIYKVAVEVKDEHKYINKDISYYDMKKCSLQDMCIDKKVSCRPLVVGSGPAGLFCALTLCYMGLKPIVIERGDDIDKRIKKTEKFIENAILDEDSNIQFGEGGAGTFSDGKLTTGISSEFIGAVLNEFVSCGAPKEIKYLNKPHIGTDELRTVIKNLREKILTYGGQFHFRTKLTDIITKQGAVVKAVTNKGEFSCDKIYLAIGHSARDTFEMLYGKSVKMISKTFSMGVRIEHLAKNINNAQYGESAKYLPTADYKMAVKTDYGNLYTFCMCPGGKVINASSEKGGVCINGMSYHKRDGINSNSALLINVGQEDWQNEHPLAGMEYQRKFERKAYNISNGYKPIVQIYSDFKDKKSGEKPSMILPSVEGGYIIADLRECLPEKVANGISEGIPLLGRKLAGFDCNSAVLTGIEARSSSPVRILRDEHFESNIKGLFPIGEGAGYAGGITSASVDGIKAVFASLL